MDFDKIYVIQNKIYSEEQLIHIINFYEQHHYNSLLPDELMYKILLESSVDNLPNLGLINKKYKKICKSNNFWRLKFENDNLPFIIDVKHKKLKSIISEYFKVKQAFDISSKLVDYVLERKKYHFKEFLVDDEKVDINELDWLPLNLVSLISKTKNDMDRSLTFNVVNQSIDYQYIPIDPKTGDEADDYERLNIELTIFKFIEYLTKLFYYIPDYIIESYDEHGDTYLEYKFMNNSEYIRIQLPEWK